MLRSSVVSPVHPLPHLLGDVVDHLTSLRVHPMYSLVYKHTCERPHTIVPSSFFSSMCLYECVLFGIQLVRTL
jgi:hypothetical protein